MIEVRTLRHVKTPLCVAIIRFVFVRSFLGTFTKTDCHPE
jgi:ABC-type maltose transport system permease subunit